MTEREENEDKSSSFRVLKTFNFDGLIIEIVQRDHGEPKMESQTMSKESESPTKDKEIPSPVNPEKELICALCLNLITKDNEVIVKKCQDIFCRKCLITAIIVNESDAVKCPSKYSNCDNEIGNDEIKMIIGADNFEIFTINRLDKKLNSLVMKHETEFQSILEEFDPLATVTQPTLSENNGCDDSFQSYPGNSSVIFNEFNDHSSIKSTMDDFESKFNLNQFIKQERDFQASAFTPAEVPSMTQYDDLGAAGLWAQNIEHHSFQGNASPAIKSEAREQQQHPVIDQKPSALTTNQYEFVCSICEMFVIEEQGVILKNCGHSFCRVCLVDSIEGNKSTPNAHCPMVVEKCGIEINDDEIQALLTLEAYHKYLDKCINIASQIDRDNLFNKSTVPALLDLENYDYIETREKFTCAICLTEKEPGEGLILKNCLHEFCKGCLGRTIEMSDELEVPCPFVAENGRSHCDGILQDRELRSLITAEVYHNHLKKSLIRAEAVIKDSFHCKTADCLGWAEKGEGATQFHCPVCLKVTCIKCEDIHEGKSCQDYFYEINADARKARDQQLTAAQEEELIARQEAMRCPGCGVVIQKTVGCNHMTCSRCRREFQWLGRQ